MDSPAIVLREESVLWSEVQDRTCWAIKGWPYYIKQGV
jgi:hypothetical protein